MTPRAEAEKAARDRLKMTWAPTLDEGECRLPIDPLYIAQRLGMKVIPARLEPDISGMLAKRAGQDAEIYLNASDSLNRQRFSCAHEIGHYVKRVSSNAQDSWGYIDRRGPSAAQGIDAAEIYANQFAAELLMPEQQVRKYARELSPAGLAIKFDVSVGAMKFRLENLGLA